MTAHQKIEAIAREMGLTVEQVEAAAAFADVEMTDETGHVESRVLRPVRKADGTLEMQWTEE